MNAENILVELDQFHWLLDHSVIEQTPELRAQVEAAQSLLGSVYQAIGARS